MRLRPTVPRRWLYAMAGSLWAAAGGVLFGIAAFWLAGLTCTQAVLAGSSGVAVAVPLWRFKFRHIAVKNIDRIDRVREQACVFSFQDWRAYLLIGAMVGLGALLRHSAIPRAWLALLYIGIGGGLIGGSLHYFARLARAEGSPPAA